VNEGGVVGQQPSCVLLMANGGSIFCKWSSPERNSGRGRVMVVTF